SGYCMVQMANKFGLRNLQHQFYVRRQPVKAFDVRYWSPREILAVFNSQVGPATLSVDGYFGLGIQPADIDLLPAKYKWVIRASESLRALTGNSLLAPLKSLADSLYVSAQKKSD